MTREERLATGVEGTNNNYLRVCAPSDHAMETILQGNPTSAPSQGPGLPLAIIVVSDAHLAARRRCPPSASATSPSSPTSTTESRPWPIAFSRLASSLSCLSPLSPQFLRFLPSFPSPSSHPPPTSIDCGTGARMNFWCCAENQDGGKPRHARAVYGQREHASLPLSLSLSPFFFPFPFPSVSGSASVPIPLPLPISLSPSPSPSPFLSLLSPCLRTEAHYVDQNAFVQLDIERERGITIKLQVARCVQDLE